MINDSYLFLMNEKVKLIQELLIKYSQSIFNMWQRIDEEIDTSILRKNKIPSKEVNDYVINLRDKIVSEELSDLWSDVNLIIGSNISISKLIDISKLMMWAWSNIMNIYENLELTEQERMIIIKSVVYNKHSLIKGYNLKRVFNKDKEIIENRVHLFWNSQLTDLKDKLINYL